MFIICSVCSLLPHFSAKIVSFEIGSNLVGPLMMSLYQSSSTWMLLVKKSATHPNQMLVQEQIFPRIRFENKIQNALRNLTYKCTLYLAQGYITVSSIQSHACVLFLHLNSNRAGLSPIALLNLYTCAFGLTSCRILLSVKRICDPTFNMIRGLFVCT